jgi:hypothetical protein
MIGLPQHPLCHDSRGELEQIQFLLGHASVQTTERYLGCKQNLGHPVNDLFHLKLRRDVQPQETSWEAEMRKGPTWVETVSRPGIECRQGGPAHVQPIAISHALRSCQRQRCELVEIRKGGGPQSLRRCSETGASGSDAESEANGQPDQATGGPMGLGTVVDPTP